jgi:hypothetical protein
MGHRETLGKEKEGGLMIKVFLKEGWVIESVRDAQDDQ